MPQQPKPLGSAAEKASTGEPSSALARLQMRKDGPWSRHCPTVHRQMSKVIPEVQDALRECAMGRSSWPLTLLGGVGCGKTCASLALCDFVIGNIKFISAADLADLLADAKCGRLKKEDNYGNDVEISARLLWDEWADQVLCVLDDIGHRETQGNDIKVRRILRVRPSAFLVAFHTCPDDPMPAVCSRIASSSAPYSSMDAPC